MKAFLAIASAATLVLSSTAVAGPPSRVTDTPSGAKGWDNSANASSNACFGQARGWFASTMGQGTNPYYPGGGTSNGDVISQRAQDGTNRENNEGFIAQYCTPSGE